MTAADKIDLILKERPALHRSETELTRPFDPAESLLPKPHAEHIASGKNACYGIANDLAHFIRDSVKADSRTLETGAGISTLIFAVQGTNHTTITPNQSEVEAIQTYAASRQINLERVQFIVKSSDQYLPQADLGKLDLVLLDGKHAFPWPVLDWFYTADSLERGGLMIVEGAQLRSARSLVDFMSVDPHWSFVRSFNGKTFVFKKERDGVHDVAWHMQPYLIQKGPVKTSWPSPGSQ